MPGKSGFFFDFIRLAGPFWNSENKTAIRWDTLMLIALTIVQIGIAVVITVWSAELFNALEAHSMAGLFTQTGLLVLIFAANVAATAMHLKIKRRLQIGWRSWLTERVIAQWMTKGRHYQVTHLQTGEHDNPDGRIAEDIGIATENAIALCHSLVYSLLLLGSFTKVLWTLSGTVTLEIGSSALAIHGHMVWLALLYAAAASYLGWWVGRPLVEATDSRQTMEANFRFGLAKARENSMAIALIHGDDNERKHFFGLFNDVIAAYDHQTKAWAHILMFTSGYSVLSMAFPILVAAPRFILGSITLGALMQSVQAFQHMVSALSWPVDNMAGVAQWRASVERVLDLVKSMEMLEQEIARPDSHRIKVVQSGRPVLRFTDLCITRLDGMECIAGFNEEIRAGERILVNGNAFSGNKLFKAIAGLWPWGRGLIELPDAESLLFMPPRPYLPVGTLRDAICYPSGSEAFSEDKLIEALDLAGVAELREQLDQSDDWESALSREQQQRLGLVRTLLLRPSWILMQESFDSLDPDGEVAMLRILCQQLPEASLLIITNQPTAERFYQRKITLE